jgi:uncharacterized protein YxjI
MSDSTETVTRYQLRDKIFSIGDDAYIDDENGSHVFRVDNQLLHIRQTFVLNDMRDEEVATLRKRIVAIHSIMDITHGGQPLAAVKKNLLALIGSRFEVSLASGDVWKIRGNVFAHEYAISHNGSPIASISKHWITLVDTFGIEIQPGYDDALVLAVAVAVDAIQDDAANQENVVY